MALKCKIEGGGIGMITKEQMMDWAETYEEAIDTLLLFANENYTKDDMLESIKDYEEQMEEGRRELEEELK